MERKWPDYETYAEHRRHERWKQCEVCTMKTLHLILFENPICQRCQDRKRKYGKQRI